MNKSYNKKGFTLVEIMIVVVIIGLLAAMAIPAFNRVRATSQANACVNNLRQIASALDQYYLETPSGDIDSFAAMVTVLVGPENYIRSTPVCPSGEVVADTSNYSNFGEGQTPICAIDDPHILPID